MYIFLAINTHKRKHNNSVKVKQLLPDVCKWIILGNLFAKPYENTSCSIMNRTGMTITKIQ